MTLEIIFLIVGLGLVVFGADFLVDGASSMARKFKISEFVIGLTIVGFGTSCPELVVSVMGALNGSPDIAVGNVIGSNIFNTLLILGVTVVIMPICITPQNRRRDVPATIAVTMLFLLLGLDKTIFGISATDEISRLDGILMLALFVVYLIVCFRGGSDSSDEGEEVKVYSTILSILYIVGGLAALVIGGRMFVDNSVAIARHFGISEKFIAITLLAGGTSLPELATSIVAASKGKGQLALGNILGSNIFNILLILGISSVIKPLSMESINFVDISALLSSVLTILFFSFTSRRNSLDRKCGVLLLLIFILYYIYLFINL